MVYRNEGHYYEVDSVVYTDTVINVDGMSITEHELGNFYTVFVEGDEVCFKTFYEAFTFVKNYQKK